MIWTKSDIGTADAENPKQLGLYLNRPYHVDKDSFHIGIIGGGPKGVYALERVVSLWSASLSNQLLTVSCFNKDTNFASGPNYDPSQPDYLLLNYPLGKVNFWIDEPQQLVGNRPDLCSFIRTYSSHTSQIPKPHQACSRSLTGIYLQYCLLQLLEKLPSNIQINLMVDDIQSISGKSGGMHLQGMHQIYENFDELMVCTGHGFRLEESLTSDGLSLQSRRLTQEVFPIKNLHGRNHAKKSMLIKGLGLTFIDSVLAMTEGAGGGFKTKGDKLIYMPSGHEPKKIFPFSRSGIPMIPSVSEKKIALKYFTTDFIETLIGSSGKINFVEMLLPMIEKEYRFQYASSYLKHSGRWPHKGEFQSLAQLESFASAFFPDFVPFDLPGFLWPEIGDGQIMPYLASFLEAVHGDLHRLALVEMTTVWPAIYPLFNKLYSFGGLTAESQEIFENTYFRNFHRVSYGPPVHNVRKIQALHEAGILDFRFHKNPKIFLDDAENKIKLINPSTQQEAIADLMLDARVAKANTVNALPPLLKGLIDDLGSGEFQIRHKFSAYPGMNPSCQLLINKHITCYGTPTEGWTLDNESLSRTNNNMATPWANQIINHYEQSNPKTNANHTLVG